MNEDNTNRKIIDLHVKNCVLITKFKLSCEYQEDKQDIIILNILKRERTTNRNISVLFSICCNFSVYTIIHISGKKTSTIPK